MRAIAHQQLHGRAAQAILARFAALYPGVVGRQNLFGRRKVVAGIQRREPGQDRLRRAPVQLLVGNGPHQRLIRAALALHAQPRRADPPDQRREPRVCAEVIHGLAGHGGSLQAGRTVNNCEHACAAGGEGTNLGGRTDAAAGRVREATMYQQGRWARDTEEQETANRQTASLAGVAVTLLLLVLGLFLVRALHNQSAIGDCLMSGRSNCDRLVQSLP